MSKALFTGLAGLSLIICIGMLILWVWSYWKIDTLWADHGWHSAKLWSMDGDIALDYHPVPQTDQPFDVSFQWSQETRTADMRGNPYDSSFHFECSPSYTRIVTPCWFPALLASSLPILWFMNFRRTRRYRPGLCQKCGYDLRASTERCPECGTPIAPLSPSPTGRGSG